MEALAEMTDEAVLSVYADASRGRGEREAAFRTLVERYQRRLFAVCVRVLGSADDAEEAVQETFVRLARSADTFRGESKLSTWMYRVARNVCTDRVRHDARRPSTPVEDVTTVADPPARDDAVDARLTGLAVETALRRLDDRSRMLLLLVAVDGLSYAEAAEVAELPVGTVKSRVSRARVQLGELLADPSPAPTSEGDGRVPAPDEARGRGRQARGPPA